MIQSGQYDVPLETLKETYRGVNYSAVLREQNRCSSGTKGFLWVLNTSVFFVIDYNFDLIEGDKSY